MTENEIAEKVSVLINEKLQKLEDLKNKVSNHAEDLALVFSVVPESSVWLDEDINVNVHVLGLKDVKEILAKFARIGFFIEKTSLDSNTPTWWLKGRNSLIFLQPYWMTYKEEAACKLVEVGKKEVPIYKLVCNDDYHGELAPETK